MVLRALALSGPLAWQNNKSQTFLFTQNCLCVSIWYQWTEASFGNIIWLDYIHCIFAVVIRAIHRSFISLPALWEVATRYSRDNHHVLTYQCGMETANLGLLSLLSDLGEQPFCWPTLTAWERNIYCLKPLWLVHSLILQRNLAIPGLS